MKFSLLPKPASYIRFLNSVEVGGSGGEGKAAKLPYPFAEKIFFWISENSLKSFGCHFKEQFTTRIMVYQSLETSNYFKIRKILPLKNPVSAAKPLVRNPAEAQISDF